tara:strand:- start:12518 stop:12943 length:426 start_codon:yes stop_codon:yes gene_type:complete
MKQSTGIDFQRAAFVDSLHSSLRQQADSALKFQDKILIEAQTYLEDGLTSEESVELLMIEQGLAREAAVSYINMSSDNSIDSEGEAYSFQFSDDYGKVWSSHDIGKVIYASSEGEAWDKAEQSLLASDIETDSVLSVNRVT